MTEPTAIIELTPRQTERWYALVDILYLMQVAWLYIFAAAYPFFGLFYGILLLAGSISAKSKRIGKICLIIGIINLAIYILALAAFLILGFTGLLAGIAAEAS